MRGRGAPAAVLSPAGACPSGDVCAQSHCSISALGCAPPSPPSLRARSLARCQPPRRSLERGFFFFPSAFTSLATVQGPVRAACSVMHNACLSLRAAVPTRLLQEPRTPSLWGWSRCEAGGQNLCSMGWEQPQLRGCVGDTHPCAVFLYISTPPCLNICV